MRIAICDDDIRERERYFEKLSKLGESIAIDINFSSYENGKQMLFELSGDENLPDIIYLDINMPDMSGLDVANALRNTGFQGEIIFLTQSEKHWQPAFDVHAYHYIVKEDCSDKRFASIFQSAVSAVYDKNQEYILFSSCGDVVSIPIKSIRYFEVIDHIVTVHYATGSFEFYSTLSKLEEQLQNRNFIRIHKSYLVSAAQVSKALHNEVTLRDHTCLPVGRAYKQAVQSAFQDKSKRKRE